MSIIPYEPVEAGQGYQIVVWKGLTVDDEGAPFDGLANSAGAAYTNFTVQVERIFDGVTVEISGCVIADKFNVLENFSVSDIKQIPAVDMIKPNVLGGKDGTKITVGLRATR